MNRLDLYCAWMLYGVAKPGSLVTLIFLRCLGYARQAVVGEVVQLVEYRTRNREVAGLTHTWSTASNLEQVANLLCAQANSAFYFQRDGK